MSESSDQLHRAMLRFHTDLKVDEDGEIQNKEVFRRNLGDESAVTPLEPILKKTAMYLRIFAMFGEDVSEGIAHAVVEAANNMVNAANQLSGMNNRDFIANKSTLINQIESAWEQIKAQVLHPVAAGILRQRILEQDLSGKLSAAEREVVALSAKLEAKFKHDLEERSAAVRDYFDKREAELQRSALKVSVQAAQDQFREAGEFYTKQVRLWGLWTLLSIVAFGALGVYLMANTRPPIDLSVIYFTAVRIILVSVIAAVATFTIRVLRANLHMRAHNAHRLRVANSVAAFVEAARTKEQSDQILAQLVNAVATFGSSGLVEGEDRPLVPIEAISKVLIEKAK